ncbi:GIN domain-containing protein (plasmid) [Aliarcobacter lanthieri]|uniref:GIN domain-containing protein n=1 Tax=Aliarcobacter lanthieri TaxID=1355374 RepID=UPI003AAC2B12
MNLIIKSPNNFKIIDGKLISKEKFELIREGEDLVIRGGEINQTMFVNGNNIIMTNNCGNTIGKLNGSTSIGACGDFKDIHINQKNISFNGYTFSFNDGDLYINGVKYLDNKNKSSYKENKEELKENEYLEYSLEKDSINSIVLSSSGNLIIEDISILNMDNLDIFVQGSGKIETLSKMGHFIKDLNISIQGSGNIEINKFQSDKCRCSAQGSGDIILKNSNFNNLLLSVMGSGDIFGKNTTAEKVSKNIIGSGDINGF